VNAEVPSTGSSEVKIRVNRSGAYREYTVTLTKPGAGTEWPWEEFKAVDVDPDSFSVGAANVEMTRVLMTVSDNFKSTIASIRVKGFSAQKIATEPEEIWRAFVENERFYLEDLKRIPYGPEGVEITWVGESGGIGQTYVDVVREWQSPIDRVQVRDFSVDAANVTMTEILITVVVPSGGTLRGITVYGEPAPRLSDTTFRIRLNERDVNEVFANITANNIVPDYDAPSDPGQSEPGDLIESFTAAYFEFQGSTGYSINIELKPGVPGVLEDIVVTDATGVVASVSGGMLRRVGTTRTYRAQLDGAVLNERTGEVTATVTTTDNRSQHMPISWDNTPVN
jgi:hypothetical protein